MKMLKVSSFLGLLELEIFAMLLNGYIISLAMHTFINNLINFNVVMFIVTLVMMIVVFILSVMSVKGIMNRVLIQILCGVISIAILLLFSFVSIFLAIPDVKAIFVNIFYTIIHSYFFVCMYSYYAHIKSPSGGADTSGA